MILDAEFSELVGKVILRIENENNEGLIFHCLDGIVFYMYHDQDCCESVQIDDINGDFNDLLNTPILKASCDTNSDLIPGVEKDAESFTWTFYNIYTIKGSVTIRWFGESNGYYSETVTFNKSYPESI